MFNLNDNINYWLFSEPADMRKSFYSLSGIVSNIMERDPLNGDAYIFINKNLNRIKILRMEHGGFVLYSKILEVGRFRRPVPCENIYWRDLVVMVKESKLLLQEEYLIFNSLEKIANWVNLPHNNVIIDIDKNNSDNEKNPHDAIAAYCGYVHIYINRFLRNKDSNNNFAIDYIDKMNEVLVKSSTVDDIIVVRWVSVYDEILKKKEGEKHEENGYLSTSLLFPYIGKYDHEQQRDISNFALLIIKIPKHTRAIYVEHISKRHEYELVIDKVKTLTIERIYKKFLKPYVIVCKIDS